MECGGLRTKNIIRKTDSSAPLLTVVTVVFNGERFLEKTIQSIINQTYNNIEYIIIDGKSTDGTLDIIKKNEDKIDYWQSEVDSGIYDAMNKAISLSHGDFINFMNCGDEFALNTTVENIFANYTKYNIIYGNVLDCDGRKIPQSRLSLINLFFEKTICHQAVFFKKELFDYYKYDTHYKLIADRKWFLDSFKVLKPCYVNIDVCKYDLNGISSNYNKFANESLELQKEKFGVLGFMEHKFKRFFRKVKYGV